jgi:hypothetical protein
MRLAALILIAIGVAGCGSGAPATPLPTLAPGSGPVSTATPVPPPASNPGQPPVACEGGLTAATCAGVATIALAAVAASGWTPTHVWLDSGNFCPNEDCLFDPDQNFPYPIPPHGGQWVANAEIAFAETDRHAGLEIEAVGRTLIPDLIGYRVPLLTWCSGSCPSSGVTDGPYELRFVLPHLSWRTGDAISGYAGLSLTGDAPTTLYGSGSLFGFSYVEVGGTRRVDPVWTADCGSHRLDPATPLTSDLTKSGGVAGTEPDADFLRAFLSDPLVHLPVGSWDITAIAQFIEAPGCAGGTTTMQTGLRVTVAP